MSRNRIDSRAHPAHSFIPLVYLVWEIHRNHQINQPTGQRVSDASGGCRKKPDHKRGNRADSGSQCAKPQAQVAAGLGSDLPLLMGISVISAGIVFGGNLAADLLYGVVDPRVRKGGARR